MQKLIKQIFTSLLLSCSMIFCLFSLNLQIRGLLSVKGEDFNFSYLLIVVTILNGFLFAVFYRDIVDKYSTENSFKEILLKCPIIVRIFIKFIFLYVIIFYAIKILCLLFSFSSPFLDHKNELYLFSIVMNASIIPFYYAHLKEL
jgi:hypothetical protein